jgi:predicted kinase
MLFAVDYVFVSNTFTKLWEMDKYIELAKTYEYNLVVYHMTTQYENVHGVPQEVVDRMLAQYEPYEGEINV